MVKVLLSALVLSVIPSGPAFVEQLQPRDSVLIADRIRYGFRMNPEGILSLGLPDVKETSNDTLYLFQDWQIDTLKESGEICASIVVVPFEEGTYHLPDIPVLALRKGGDADTLVFEGVEMEVKSIPVDTATFKPFDIKAQINYPVTFAEAASVGLVVLGGLGVAVLLALLIIRLVRRFSSKKEEEGPKDPAHIVALRELDKYRSEKFWAPDKQKIFYSGITDALRVYMGERFTMDAPEMTTGELFDALDKVGEPLDETLKGELKELFEMADFIKFAKALASDEENAKALPLAVRFVTSTYQSEIENS